MKKMILIIISLGLVFVLTGCGTDSGSYKTSLVTVVYCDDGWTDINNGQDINSNNSTQLKFTHDSNGNKKVCVVSGSATIQ